MALQNFTGEDLSSKPWFRGAMTREAAQSELARDGTELGTFVVRNSSQPGAFALTYLNRHGKVKHSLISKTDEGYKLPEERQVFPTVGGLLRTCRFLKWSDDLDPKALALLTEMFPEESDSEVRKILARARNDVDTAVELMLSRQTQTSVTIGTSATRSGRGEAHGDDGLSLADVNAATEPVADEFLRLSKFSVNARDIPERWRSLEGRVTRGISRTLEGNLLKILATREHPMGKKVSMFCMAFNLNYGTPPDSMDDCKTKIAAALDELTVFFGQMRQSVATKVTELNTTAGSLMVWRAVERVVVTEVQKSLRALMDVAYAIRNAELAQALEHIRSSSVHRVVDATSQIVAVAGVAVRASRARALEVSDLNPAADALAGLPSLTSTTDKLATLVTAVHAIDDAVSSKSNGLGATASALLPLLISALALSHATEVIMDIELARALLPTAVACGQEGFALAALAAAVDKAPAVAASLTSPPPSAPPRALQGQMQQQTAGASGNGSFVPFTAFTNAPHDPAEFGVLSNIVVPNGDASYNNTDSPSNFATLKRAEQSYIETLHLMENDVAARNKLSEHYYQRGDMVKAAEHAKRALELDPANSAAKANLAACDGASRPPGLNPFE